MANMGIAKAHRFSRKFVGYITAAGTIIAYALSFLTVTAGVFIYALQSFSEGYMWVVSALIGALFSILVERMTLTQAAKVRHVNEQRNEIKKVYDRIEDRTEQVEKNYQRELKEAERGYKWAVMLMLLGVVISTAASTLFWHFVLQHMPVIQAWLYSTIFSLVISFTLVSSELHKRLDTKVIGESIVADNYVGLAAREDARDQIMSRFAAQHQQALAQALDTDTMGQIANATAMQTVDSVFNGGGAIPSQVSRERQLIQEEQRRERERTAQQMQQVNASRGNIRPINSKVKVTQDLGGNTDELFAVDHPF